jgi:hypothetical protein
MTIQDLSSIGELIAAIATLATLVYLAAQIRHNTRAIMATLFMRSQHFFAGNLIGFEHQGFAVAIVFDPLRVVARGHAHIGVPELRRHVAELHSRRQQVRCERVAEACHALQS